MPTLLRVVVVSLLIRLASSMRALVIGTLLMTAISGWWISLAGIIITSALMKRIVNFLGWCVGVRPLRTPRSTILMRSMAVRLIISLVLRTGPTMRNVGSWRTVGLIVPVAMSIGGSNSRDCRYVTWRGVICYRWKCLMLTLMMVPVISMAVNWWGMGCIRVTRWGGVHIAVVPIVFQLQAVSNKSM